MNNKPVCATEDTYLWSLQFNQTTTGTHPWNGEIVVYVDKDDKKFRKVKKLLINIWPTYDQIDLRPVSQNGSRP
jgi:hypothetical protein